MFSVEIITHCWAAGPNGAQYAKALQYQIRSLLDNPQKLCSVQLSVCIATEQCDRETWAVLKSECPKLAKPVRVMPWIFPKEFVLQRPYGRNIVALGSNADIVFFTDCDYAFGPGCLDSLIKLAGRQEKLFFPEVTRISRDHATGDKYLNAEPPLPLDPKDFIFKKERKAIGGLQIVPGDIAREYGYCKDVKRLQAPVPPDCNTIRGFHGDSVYRKILGTRGVPFTMPNLFRIRHSQTGDGRVPKELQGAQKA